MGKLLHFPPAALRAAIDQAIDQALEGLRATTVRKVAVTRPALATDRVTLDLSAVCTLPDGTTRRLFTVWDYPYTAGETFGLFPWPLSVLGNCAGDRLTWTDPTVPATYPDPDYRGLPALLSGQLTRVEEWTDPLPLTDALIRLYTPYPSIASFRASMRAQLLAQAGFPE